MEHNDSNISTNSNKKWIIFFVSIILFMVLLTIFFVSTQPDYEKGGSNINMDNGGGNNGGGNNGGGGSGGGNNGGGDTGTGGGNNGGGGGFDDSLAVPEAFVNGSTITWEPVYGAMSYNVLHNGIAKNQTETSYSVKNTVGVQYVMIQSQGASGDVSLWSPWITASGEG
ncbi:MAG: hypothetical protein LBU60_02840 [Clostridiales bacterium]|jgi:hypothetical protein|nr:hypothetical protein [Clostridiales bacterium]